VRADLSVGSFVRDHPIFDLAIDWHADGDPPGEGRPIANCVVRYSSGIEGAGPEDMLLLPLDPVGSFGVEFPERIGVWLMEAFSHGTIRMRSCDPRESPAIEVRLWSVHRDVERMADGVGRACELLDRAPFVERGGRRRTVGFLGEPIADPGDAVATRDMLLQRAVKQAHISSSAPIGRAGSERGVVDTGGRVHGIERMRVGDLSILPTCPRSGPYLTAMMLGDVIAEALAD
jgi:choline dehydrogenase/5-(hydroxymethyl)furfural/furfural oxidase